MKKLSKADITRRDDITKRLAEEFGKLEAEHAKIEDAVNAYNEAIVAFNEIVEEARGFAEDMASSIDSYISDKSDKWQEGERGQAYDEWKGEWEGIDFEDIDEVALPDAPSSDHVETLEQAPEEPSA